jgi:hypothetical protein
VLAFDSGKIVPVVVGRKLLEAITVNMESKAVFHDAREHIKRNNSWSHEFNQGQERKKNVKKKKKKKSRLYNGATSTEIASFTRQEKGCR